MVKTDTLILNERNDSDLDVVKFDTDHLAKKILCVDN